MQWNRWKCNHFRLLLLLQETTISGKNRSWEDLQIYENERPPRDEWEQAEWKNKAWEKENGQKADILKGNWYKETWKIFQVPGSFTYSMGGST